MKTILCYGDSNTWGYIPAADHANKARYPRTVRWPGLLQKNLGEDYYVVEEGLNSRTTNLDYASPPERNGKTYLPPCLYTHAPIDLVILALGGNDTKAYFNRTAEEIKAGLGDLIDVIQQSLYGPELQSAPQILITTPAIPHPIIETFTDEEGVLFLEGAVKKSEALIELFKELAEEKGCFYLDLSAVRPSAIDGVHYDELGHQQLAALMTDELKKINY